MYVFSYPWVFLLLLLPVGLPFVLPSYRESHPAIRATWFSRIVTLFDAEPADGVTIRKTGKFEYFMNYLLWGLIVLALARPQYVEPPIEQIIPTRDILLVVDLSGSMETLDFVNSQEKKVDRLQAVKEVLDDFLTKRKGDRVGLIIFGNAPFVQVPFTQDLEACRLLLGETAPRMAGPRTAFGDAIGLGISLFERSEVTDRVMIALTDGNDTGSKVPPAEAARIARDNDIIIHVVGVGDPAAAGEEKLDEEALEKVSTVTGGKYFFAADRDKLQSIYAEIDGIGTREIEAQSYRPRIDLFHWPLGCLVLLSLFYYGIRLIVPRSGLRKEHGNG